MILDEIVAYKRKELDETKKTLPLQVLQKAMAYSTTQQSFVDALRAKDFALIAEVKKASPSAGILREDYDPLAIARIYKESGAAAISVLTERKYFQGDIDTMRYIRQDVVIPVLRKDFLFDAYQLFEAKLYGADAVLLIVAILDLPLLKNMLELCLMMEMAPLVEVHTEPEMEMALSANAEIIGVNNRDLKTLKIDLETTPKLLDKFPETQKKLIISESGIQSRKDVEKLRDAGANGILVGETILKSSDIPAKIRELMGTP